MSTRNRILDSARKLFNRQGLAQVSVRDICADIRISPGNFSYHFPSKNKLVTDLYAAMQKEYGSAIAGIDAEQGSIAHFLEIHRRLFSVQYRYRFFYLNLFEILHHHQDIRISFRKQYQMEAQLGKMVVKKMIADGIVLPGITDAQIESIVSTGQVLNNSWAVDAEIDFSGSFKDKLRYYMRLCCDRVLPFLTDLARSEYEAYFETLE